MVACFPAIAWRERISRGAVACLAALLLSACASGHAAGKGVALRPSEAVSPAASPEREEDELASMEKGGSGEEVYTDLIRGMLAQQQYYAALAHIQQLQRSRGNSDELRFLEAEAHRQLGQVASAEPLYRGLLRGDYAARAYRGLGLLYVNRNLNSAIDFLRESVQRQPTDVDARNDLGYALMLAGRYQEALPQIATAVELDPASSKARNNLLILLMLSGDEAGVKRVVSAGGVPSETLAQLRKQAQALKVRTAIIRGAK